MNASSSTRRFALLAAAALCACSKESSLASAQPVAVSISPASASIDSCQVLSFSATVTGSGNTAVTWSVEEGSAGGIITADGVYTAPSSAGTYHVLATSQVDPTKKVAATVVVTDRILGIAISPPDATVPAGGSVLFTATVTTTCGTFTATRVVTAPK